MHTFRTLFSLTLAVAAFSPAAQAGVYLGGSAGAITGIDGLKTGGYGAVTVGYEFAQQPAQTRFALEGTIGGQGFESDYYSDDTISIGYMMVGGRVTQYFQAVDRGLYGYLGADGGFAVVREDYEWSHHHTSHWESDGVFASQLYAGLGYAINAHWRVAAEYHRFRIDDAKDGSTVILYGGSYNTWGVAFDYVW